MLMSSGSVGQVRVEMAQIYADARVRLSLKQKYFCTDFSKYLQQKIYGKPNILVKVH